MRALALAFVLIAWDVAPSQAQHHPLVGTWRSSVITQAGEQQVEVVIQANGTYSQQWRGRNILNTFTGRWRDMGSGSSFRYRRLAAQRVVRPARMYQDPPPSRHYGAHPIPGSESLPSDADGR